MQRKPEVKSQVTILVREMREAGMPIKRQQALEMVAKMYGYRDWNTMSSKMDEEAQKPAAPEVPYGISHFDPATQIALIWSVYDVQDVRPDLTDDEAYDVLQKVSRKHDADQGVNWDTLRETASWDFNDRIVPCTITFYPEGGDEVSLPATVNLTEGGQVLVDGKLLSEVNPDDDGDLSFEALPGEVFDVMDGRLFGEFETEDAEYKECVQDLVADLHAAGALTDTSQ